MTAKGASLPPSAFLPLLPTSPHSRASCSPAARGSHPRSGPAFVGTREKNNGILPHLPSKDP